MAVRVDGVSTKVVDSILCCDHHPTPRWQLLLHIEYNNTNDDAHRSCVLRMLGGLPPALPPTQCFAAIVKNLPSLLAFSVQQPNRQRQLERQTTLHVLEAMQLCIPRQSISYVIEVLTTFLKDLVASLASCGTGDHSELVATGYALLSCCTLDGMFAFGCLVSHYRNSNTCNYSMSAGTVADTNAAMHGHALGQAITDSTVVYMPSMAMPSSVETRFSATLCHDIVLYAAPT